MHVFEYGKKSNMNELSPDQQRFTAKMIVKEVQRIAKEHNIRDICMDFMMEIGNCSKIYIELLTIKKIGADRRT